NRARLETGCFGYCIQTGSRPSFKDLPPMSEGWFGRSSHPQAQRAPGVLGDDAGIALSRELHLLERRQLICGCSEWRVAPEHHVVWTKEVHSRADGDGSLAGRVSIEAAEILGRCSLEPTISLDVFRRCRLQLEPGAVDAPTECWKDPAAVVQVHLHTWIAIEHTGGDHTRGEHAHLIRPAERSP